MKAEIINRLKNELEGETDLDLSSLIQYATDASIYKEMPEAVVFPKNEKDITTLIRFAREYKLNLIPRAAGTSLAGQVVGNGLIVDISKYFTRITEINTDEGYAVVQPGVVRDELNMQLATSGLFFAPETSTSSRCCIGGMFGNNSCGANSLIYGSTRDHILSVKAILGNGDPVEFSALSGEEFEEKCRLDNFEGSLYRDIYRLLSPGPVREEIKKQFPHPDIRRRSMGYAIDELIGTAPFTGMGEKFNFSKLLTGSEGTLAFITELKIKLSALPPPHKILLSVQTDTMEEALEGNILALRHHPYAIELIDRTILDLAKKNISQNRNRFFIQGDPAAVLIIEIVENSEEAVHLKAEAIRQTLYDAGIDSFSCLIEGKDMDRVWALRKAGLGIMSNAKGDAKPVTVIEDVALHVEKYPEYYKELTCLLDKFGLSCAFYGHISTGELHNKPIFNLKDKNETDKLRDFAYRNALLVKKLGGCLSGEHGDGRLRGEFLPLMLGEQNYRLLQDIKKIFDPYSIFNNGKIVGAPPMNEHIRYETNEHIKIREKSTNKTIESREELDSFFDFSDTEGVLRAIEKCNGSADCKKSRLFAGTMCPSYRATGEEKYSTRARANILREFLRNSDRKNPFDHREIFEILDTCLACKACKSECPSNVDMTKLKSEFLYQYYKQHPVPFRSRLISYYPALNRLGLFFYPVFNYCCSQSRLSGIIKKIMGFSPQRSLPLVHSFSLKKWTRHHPKENKNSLKTVYLFNDEFTNTQDVSIGIKAVELLQALGYQVKFTGHSFSGRTFISKGDLKKARKLAEKNISLLSPLIDENCPLLGIEPSAILSFRDEYPDLVRPDLKKEAVRLSQHVYLIDEFIASEFKSGYIRRQQFSSESKHILFHSHCYQKALSNPADSITMMEIPPYYTVTEIKSGCCGMAGAFGYEKEHYELSMKVGEMALFPAIRDKEKETVVTATGTSCRHQIKDGTGEKSFHPIEILHDAFLWPENYR